MADKRIRQLFEFAERNIQNRPVLKSHHPLVVFALLFTVLLLILSMAAVEPSKEKTIAKPPVERTIISQSLSSKIPSLHASAIRQHLYPTPLRKADLIFFHHEGEDFKQTWVVLDSVVFIPKVSG